MARPHMVDAGVRLSVVVERVQRDQLKKTAKQREMSVSQLVREILREGL